MSQRPILSILSETAREERMVPVATVDVLLPCRYYTIEHKVTTLGKLALATELLLRLFKSADGISEEDAAAFFGFTRKEFRFVLQEVERVGHVERKDGRLWLTQQGAALFREGAVNPEIFEVEKRRETHGFDLLCMAPQKPSSVTASNAGFLNWL